MITDSGHPSSQWSLPCGCTYQPGRDLPVRECGQHAPDPRLSLIETITEAYHLARCPEPQTCSTACRWRMPVDLAVYVHKAVAAHIEREMRPLVMPRRRWWQRLGNDGLTRHQRNVIARRWREGQGAADGSGGFPRKRQS